jgi:hypothetical protein
MTSLTEPATTEKALAPEPKPRRGAEHERLEMFIGDWRGTGAGGQGGKMATLESYDWVEGRFFLTCRFDQQSEVSHIGVSTIGFDRSAGGYRLHAVDNAGYARDYDMIDDGDGVWTIRGERERARCHQRLEFHSKPPV